jgi:hypothetical protein
MDWLTQLAILLGQQPVQALTGKSGMSWGVVVGTAVVVLTILVPILSGIGAILWQISAMSACLEAHTETFQAESQAQWAKHSSRLPP